MAQIKSTNQDITPMNLWIKGMNAVCPLSGWFYPPEPRFGR